MLRYTISDGLIKAEINSLGAELKSLVNLETKTEFLWNGNPEFWGRTSPVLFPIVGGLKEDTFSYKDKKYILTQHGFARDNEFTLVSKSEKEILFLLKSSNETKTKYPFEFKFYIGYKIEEGRLNIEYKVVNSSTKEMLFSIGAHPAFSTPLSNDIQYSDYYLEFEKKETASTFPLEGRNISRKTIKFLEDENKIKLKKDTFENDAIIFKDLESTLVSLKCKKSDRVVTINYKGFEYMAFWNKVGAPFVCIEPWNGIADFVDASGRLEDKDGVITLKTNEDYFISLGIEVKG